MGRCLSLYPLTHSGTGSFWKPATVIGTMTGAKLRLTTRSQTYRATCWTAAKWLCFSLWGNSLLSLMLTVVVGYWGLARLLGWVGKKEFGWKWAELRAKMKMCSGWEMEAMFGAIAFELIYDDTLLYSTCVLRNTYVNLCKGHTKPLCLCLFYMTESRKDFIGVGLLCLLQLCLLILSPYWHKRASSRRE